MVAKNGDFAIAVFEELDLLVDRVLITVNFTLVQLDLESVTGIVGPKHLSRQILHRFLHKVIQPPSINLLKDVHILLLGLTELPQVPLHQRVDLHRVQVLHAIFTEEVEFDLSFAGELDVFDAQRAATDGVCFVFAFFVADSQSKFVD